MRVVLVANFQAEHSAALAEALAKDHHVFVLCWENVLAGLNLLQASTAEVRVVRSIRPGAPSNLIAGLRLLQEVKRIQPDVVHIQNPYTWQSPWMPWFHEWPLVLTLHDPLPHLGRLQPHWRLIFSWTLRFADAVIVHGEAMKRLVVSTYGYPIDRLHVVPIGAYAEFARPAAPPPTQVDVLFFGRILFYKGLANLLKADPIVRQTHPSYRLVIVGEGDLREYEPLLQPNPHVSIVNRYVNREEAAGFLQHAKVVVLPYVDASQSGVVAAALATGTPVIATSVGSLPEVVEDGKTGLIVPPGDVRALADAIVRLLSDERFRKELAKSALRKAEVLSWDAVGRMTSRVYEAVRCESSC